MKKQKPTPNPKKKNSNSTSEFWKRLFPYKNMNALEAVEKLKRRK